MRISASLRICKKNTRSTRGLGTETRVPIRHYSRHEWQDGNKSRTKHHQIKEQLHERKSSGKQTWQHAIAEVMVAVVVVLEITGGCLTVHPQNSFRKNRKTPTDSKATTRTDWKIPNSPRLRERKPITYCGVLPQKEQQKQAGRVFPTTTANPRSRLPRRKPTPNNMRGTSRNHTPAPSLAKPSPAHTCPEVVVFGMEVK